ncbi:MAG: M48 family metallopeptidase [Actinomycetales bacterium]|nr:M48 family metallopeptidase [Actinomycetales bacterium]
MSTASRADVEVRRSRRRTRTVSAFREEGRIIVAIPARFSRAQEREWVEKMVADLERKESRRRPSDAELARRATELSARYLGGRAVPASVAWSARQKKRWGSCTPSDRSIRLSTRLQGMPAWVVDYVLLHELNHLLHVHHDAAFWAELSVYPEHERAKAFLDGVSWADRAGAPADLDDDVLEDEGDDDAPGAAALW